MRSYLDLISIQAKMNRRQNRMTKICIFLSVLLIMGLFGMADMEIRSETIQAIRQYGSWHAFFQGLTDEQAAILAARPEVAVSARFDSRNYHLNEGWQIEGIPTAICGFDQALIRMMPSAQMTEGRFPEKENELVCTDSIQNRLGLSPGDEITVISPAGEPLRFVISGLIRTTSMLSKADAFGIFVNTETYRNIFSDGGTAGSNTNVYVEFIPFCRVQKVIANICEQMELSEKQVGQNTMLLGLKFQSNDTYLIRFYLVAAGVAVLVAAAGILMITGSLNSSVAQRTEFFGLMRCLGASPGQVKKFVRREALGWCWSAIPAALLCGTVILWGLCGLLRFLSPEFFGELPIFAVSWIGICTGTGIGILTVLLAARSPAKRASRVSPLAAVSGNAGTVYAAKRAANTRWMHVETALGIHHAKGSLKNFLLMSGSFAFGIILFLSFSTLHDFMDHALTPLRPESPDISIISQDDTRSIPLELAETLAAHPAVRRVFGRNSAEETAEAWNREKEYTIIDLQVKRGTTDADAEELRILAGDGVIFSDKRMSNAEVMGAYYAFLLFLYGFLVLILMISTFHIINSMAMSVSVRMNQYRSLYAIGMSKAQILRMTAAEAGAYLLSGILMGVPAGLLLHRTLFRVLVTSRWGSPWTVPVQELLAVLTVITVSTAISLAGPSRRIRRMEGIGDFTKTN